MKNKLRLGLSLWLTAVTAFAGPVNVHLDVAPAQAPGAVSAAAVSAAQPMPAVSMDEAATALAPIEVAPDFIAPVGVSPDVDGARQAVSAAEHGMADGNFAATYAALGSAFEHSALPVTGEMPHFAVAAAEADSTKHPRSGLHHPRSQPVSPAEGDESDPTPGKGRDSSKPLPPARVVESALPSLDDAVEMHVSHSYPGVPGVNPSAEVVQHIDAYIAYKGMPNSQKHYVLKFYEIGQPTEKPSAVVQAIERLRDAGIRTTIITDINQSMVGKFADGEHRSTDFESADYKESGPGRATKYLREKLGFTFAYDENGKNKFTILSGVPLFNPKDKSEKPLMHDKGVAALGADGKAWDVGIDLTANMNEVEEKADGESPSYGGRYNRVVISKDKAANQVDWDHILGEIASYSKREGVKGLSEELNVPIRVVYPNGEFREMAWTNGKQNPNDRITAVLTAATKALTDAKAAKTQPAMEIDEIILSHFVLTNTPEVEALRAYLNALRDFYPGDWKKRIKIFGVFDQQFISPDGWGEAGALDGVLVQRPMGRSVFPFSSDFADVMELYGYIRLLTGVDLVDPDAAPTRVHLWHDKTTMIKVREKDEKTGEMTPWTYAWTRSLNNSGHYQSMESQDMFRMRPDSRLAKKFEASIKEVVKAEPQYAIPLDKAIAMFWLAHFTHHTVYDSGMLGYAEKAIDSLTKQAYPALEATLTEVAAIPSKHVKAALGSEIKDRIAQFVNFLGWYADEAKSDSSLNRMTYRKAINVGVALATKIAWGMRTALDIVYFNPKRAKPETEQLKRKAWKEGLKMAEPYPEPKVRASA